eukprot:4674089-Pyramimonas_sp.AAC.1
MSAAAARREAEGKHRWLSARRTRTRQASREITERTLGAASSAEQKHCRQDANGGTLNPTMHGYITAQAEKQHASTG